MSESVGSAPPLVEVIFEMQWQLPNLPDGRQAVDPLYKLAVGSLYEALKNDYPVHTALPASVLPDEISAYIVQHQFRKGETSWPLVQLGQGIFTLNDTQRYKWDDFHVRIASTMASVAKFYADNNRSITTKSLSLRYINSLPFDYVSGDGLEYLSKLGVSVHLRSELLKVTDNGRPSSFDLRFTFETSIPADSHIQLRFGTGTSASKELLLLWETAIITENAYDCTNVEQAVKWAASAHDVAKTVFLSITQGLKEE
jgi:uncharacterized protein (TIGR04255 family)